MIRVLCRSAFLIVFVTFQTASPQSATNLSPYDRMMLEGQIGTGSYERLEPVADDLDSVGPKIFVGGKPVYLPEVLRIEFAGRNGQGSLCTGVAVAADKVLTAGHCGCSPWESYVVRAIELGSETPAPERTLRLAAKPRIFPGYDCRFNGAPQPGRDLALLELDGSIDKVRPAPVAPMFLVYDHPETRRVLIAGYGRTESGRFPLGLLGAFSRIADHFCRRGVFAASRCSRFREFVLSNMVSGSSAAADSCDGDSGGPVYWHTNVEMSGGTQELHRFLIGITSRGLRGVPQFGPTACGGGGIYTSIGHVDIIAWLTANGAPVEVGLEAKEFAYRVGESIE